MQVQDVSVVRARTHTFNIKLYNEDQTAYTLGSGEKLIFGIKKDLEKEDYLVKKTATSAQYVTDHYEIALYPADTADLLIGTYFYDIGLQRGTDYYTVVPTSRFDLVANVTVKEAT